MDYSRELMQRLLYNQMSQSDLAKMLNVSKSAVSQWVKGTSEPSVKHWEIIVEKLPVSHKEFKNISIKKASEILGKSEQFIRIGLQRGFLDFGKAVKNGSKYNYHISPYKLMEYVGG